MVSICNHDIYLSKYARISNFTYFFAKIWLKRNCDNFQIKFCVFVRVCFTCFVWFCFILFCFVLFKIEEKEQQQQRKQTQAVCDTGKRMEVSSVECKWKSCQCILFYFIYLSSFFFFLWEKQLSRNIASVTQHSLYDSVAESGKAPNCNVW